MGSIAFALRMPQGRVPRVRKSERQPCRYTTTGTFVPEGAFGRNRPKVVPFALQRSRPSALCVTWRGSLIGPGVLLVDPEDAARTLGTRKASTATGMVLTRASRIQKRRLRPARRSN